MHLSVFGILSLSQLWLCTCQFWNTITITTMIMHLSVLEYYHHHNYDYSLVSSGILSPSQLWLCTCQLWNTITITTMIMHLSVLEYYHHHNYENVYGEGSEDPYGAIQPRQSSVRHVWGHTVHAVHFLAAAVHNNLTSSITNYKNLWKFSSFLPI